MLKNCLGNLIFLFHSKIIIKNILYAFNKKFCANQVLDVGVAYLL